MKTRREPQDDRPDGLTHNPFAKLRAGGSDAPPPAPRAPLSRGGAGRGGESTPAGPLVVRREKRGRGGKTVTRVRGLELEPAALVDLARELARALGCGAGVEDGELVLQGAQTERAAGWLRGRLGVRVTIGN